MSERSRSAISRSHSSSTTDRKREARWPRLRAAREEGYNSFPRERERRPGCRSDFSATWVQDVGDSHAARSAGHRNRHWTVWVTPAPCRRRDLPKTAPRRASWGLCCCLPSDRWSRERMRTGEVFAEALRAGDAAAVKRVPKTDLHAHAYLSARIETLERQLGHALLRPPHRMNGLTGMLEFLRSAIDPHFGTREGAELLATAAVADAINDGVSVFEMSFDIWPVPRYFDGLHGFLRFVRSLVQQCQGRIRLRPELGISRRHVSNAALMDLAPRRSRPQRLPQLISTVSKTRAPPRLCNRSTRRRVRRG